MFRWSSCALLVALASFSLAGISQAQTQEVTSSAMTKVGDLNADGRGDLVILKSVLKSRAGFYVLKEINFVDGPSLAVLTSILPERTNLRSPHAYRLGDVDGDGADDVAITSVSADKKRADTVALYSGRTGAMLRHLKLGKGSITILAITRTGDADGDGISDIVVGAAQDRPEVRSLSIYSGATGARIKRINTKVKLLFAQSLDTIADRNADGIPDILAGGNLKGPAKGGGYSIFSGKDLKLLYEYKSQDPNILLGDDVHAGVDLTRDHVPEYVVSVLDRRAANHRFLVYNGASGGFMYSISSSGGYAGQQAFGTRINSRFLDFVTDIDYDCIPEAVVLADDAGVRLYSGANGSFIRQIASASSYATLTQSTKPYSWYLALSGVSGQRVLDVRTMFYDPLRIFCDG